MSATTVLAAAAGVAVGAGVWLVALGLRPVPAGQPSRARAASKRVRRLLDAGGHQETRTRRIRLLGGLAAGALAWLLSGWVIAVAVLPLAAVGLPNLLGKPDTGSSVDRLEALEEWTRNLAGVLDVGVGLEQAITVNLRSAPDAIRPEVQALVARLSARWPTEAALRAFAADLDDATGDLVAASLVLGAQRRGAGLTRVLEGLAQTVAEEVRMRRQVEADRAKPRTTARAVTIITLVVLTLLTLNGDYVAPYGSPLGQLVLALLLGLYVAALVWMRAMTRGRPPTRFLTGRVSAGPLDAHSGHTASRVA